MKSAITMIFAWGMAMLIVAGLLWLLLIGTPPASHISRALIFGFSVSGGLFVVLAFVWLLYEQITAQQDY